ncbi:MAG: hypothetical protein L6437_09195 [Kiritimatiellae bacterium]|nr:hypothetical protein [Kiritimatiellia bacterium]
MITEKRKTEMRYAASWAELRYLSAIGLGRTSANGLCGIPSVEELKAKGIFAFDPANEKDKAYAPANDEERAYLQELEKHYQIALEKMITDMDALLRGEMPNWKKKAETAADEKERMAQRLKEMEAERCHLLKRAETSENLEKVVVLLIEAQKEKIAITSCGQKSEAIPAEAPYDWKPSKPNDVMSNFRRTMNYDAVWWTRHDGHSVSPIQLGRRKIRASKRQEFIAELFRAWNEKRTGLTSKELTPKIYGYQYIGRPDWKGLFKKNADHLRVWTDLIRLDGQTYRLNIK